MSEKKRLQQATSALRTLDTRIGARLVPDGTRAGSAHLRRTGRALVERNRRIAERDRYRCQRCGIAATRLEIDHIVPLHAGGDDSAGNLQTLCVRCHAAKSAAERARIG